MLIYTVEKLAERGRRLGSSWKSLQSSNVLYFGILVLSILQILTSFSAGNKKSNEKGKLTNIREKRKK